MAEKSVQDLARLAQLDAPFFLAVGFRKPHLPFNAPARYWLDENKEQALPITWAQAGTDIPVDFATHPSPELRSTYDALPLFSEPDDEQARQIVSAYHAATRYADAQVGQVLNALEQSTAAGNTIVVFMGDHGFLLGQQGMWTKHALFEPALLTPLVIADPRIAAGNNGGKVTAVTDLLDVYPTLADLADLPLPAHLEGASLQPLLKNSTQAENSTKPVSVARWQNGESIRNSTYRYTRWFDKDNQTLEEMLFNLASDPAETTNVVDDTELTAVIDELRQRLGQSRSGPVWSEALESSVSQWNLVRSPPGRFLIAALAHPLYAILVVGLFLVFVVVVIRRLLRRRRSSAS